MQRGSTGLCTEPSMGSIFLAMDTAMRKEGHKEWWLKVEMWYFGRSLQAGEKFQELHPSYQHLSQHRGTNTAPG